MFRIYVVCNIDYGGGALVLHVVCMYWRIYENFYGVD